MRNRFLATVPTLVFCALACADNPVAVEDDHEETLTAELALSSEHVHTLSELVFSVVVRDGHGDVVTDLEAVTVDRLAVGSDTWRSTELALQGSAWIGPYTFMSTGEYQLRVSVTRHGHQEPEVVHAMSESLHVGRAHMEVAGYRVEFESFPGHLHEGDEAEMKFWVFEAEKNAAGVRPPVAGLSVHIGCLEASGAFERHGAAEAEHGVYSAHHTFAEAGAFVATLHLPGAHQAEFTTQVAHKH